eukprot:1889688-Amphidinium_carterae.1
MRSWLVLEEASGCVQCVQWLWGLWFVWVMKRVRFQHAAVFNEGLWRRHEATIIDLMFNCGSKPDEERPPESSRKQKSQQVSPFRPNCVATWKKTHGLGLAIAKIQNNKFEPSTQTLYVFCSTFPFAFLNLLLPLRMVLKNNNPRLGKYVPLYNMHARPARLGGNGVGLKAKELKKRTPHFHPTDLQEAYHQHTRTTERLQLQCQEFSMPPFAPKPAD